VSLGFAFRFGVVASSLECGGRASSLNKCGSGGDRANQVVRWWQLCRGGRAVVVVVHAVMPLQWSRVAGRWWCRSSYKIIEMGCAGIRVALFCGVI